jgi:hypothetical protein
VRTAAPAETTAQRYQKIATAGFDVVLPPSSGLITAAPNRQILELCARTGLKAIVADPRLQSEGSAAPGPDEEALNAVVADYRPSPALLGSFLQDKGRQRGELRH